jgi:ATP-dependent Clp endopeptidase proteolytic subunit ClpP
MPKLSDKIDECMLRNRTVVLSSTVDNEEREFYRKMVWLYEKDPHKKVRVILNSPGGDVYDGITIYNTIRGFIDAGLPVDIEVMGLCASMAAIVLQAASTRIAYKYTRFLLHEVSEFTFFSEETATEKEEEARELCIVNRTMATILAERAGKPVEEVLQAIKKHQLWMSAEEAKAWGLVDEVK